MAKTKHLPGNRPPAADDEQGFILVLALGMLVVLSIMGTAAMTVRNTEVAIVANAEVMQNTFYALEAVTLEGTTEIENIKPDSILINLGDPTKPPPPSPKYDWLKPNDPDLPPLIYISKSSTWSGGGQISPKETGLASIKPPGYTTAGADPDRIRYAAVQGNLHSDENEYDACAGSDLSDETKRVKCYSVYGMYDVKSGAGKAYSGRRMLLVGYKKTVYN